MKTSNVDKAFSKMPKLINVPQMPQINNFMGYNQMPTQMQMNYQQQFYQMQPDFQYMGSMGYPQQYNQQAQFTGGYPPQGFFNSQQQNQEQNTQKQQIYQNLALEYTKHYVEYWNNYYEQLKNGPEPEAEASNLKEQSASSLNDRYFSDKKQGQNNENNGRQKDSNLMKSSKFAQSQADSKEKLNQVKKSITEEANEAKSELSLDSDILREEYKKKQVIEEEDVIPVNQNFILDQSIDEDDFDKYIPECKVDPNMKLLEQIEEYERLDREREEQIKREQEEKEKEEERKRQEELREQMEHDQFYADNPEIYLEHRKQQKKVIFETLKLEMDKLIEKTQKIEEDLFDANQGITQAKKELESNNIKRKKTEFYLRAKQLQYDIDNIIENNQEEKLAETNFQLLKGLHETILDDQLERMYENNQKLFLEVSNVLTDIVGVKSKQGSFGQYNYYESLKQKAQREVKEEKEEMERKRKLYGKLLPPQKSIKRNVLDYPKDKKRSNSKSKSQEKKKQPLHKKAWGQH
ncbi:hypothetical protein TTHERM_00859250 (macronuclear) [Tetrahymena thermophila SB210]|uniref:Uncharacterized protein n=1 Tax=Tetrahymena thermophila (strain SB210) TaxID=312017 RepID=Q23YT5_TETTS|nr:hypothetical protein TTHERM_00859250 [Tetrahymena thermophila SB210]EAS01720.4 hypothetical protein TTHERM_00859250 [Tetrahymena thermophila SB210]|eukprot:XP_001021965.4 hypothetical protein TTHERM_00859250 [Tetrahymena thermophila SB210]